MSSLLEVGKADYIALETFKRDGTAVNTPVWVTIHNSKLYVMTDGNSWKVKRIRNNPRVRIAPSDMRGNPQGDFIEGNATIIKDDAAFELQVKRIIKKHPLMGRLLLLPRKFRPNPDRVDVLIEITD